MANIKSAKKRIKVNEKKRMTNKINKSELRTSIKNLELAISEGKKEEAIELNKIVIKRLDSSVNKGIIHKNKAARDKSRLTKKVNAM